MQRVAGEDHETRHGTTTASEVLGPSPRAQRRGRPRRGPDLKLRSDAAALREGWVIANHILVSFHVAFISSVLALPPTSILKWEVLRFIFASPETLVSAVFMYLSFHICVALHEMGHFLTAARLNALNESILAVVKERLGRSLPQRWLYYLGQVLRAPFGWAPGIKREGLNYYPDAPYNLAVAAAGPRASGMTALVTLPPAVALITLGLGGGYMSAIYGGRFLLGVGLVSLLDFWLADPGKYAAFRDRERQAQERAKSVGSLSGWLQRAQAIKRRIVEGRMQQGTHPRLGPVAAPWQFRNCGMGGRHTEKEYPESNISMQEAMFLILSSPSYQEAQELTVRLQTRLKEIIEKEEGCRVMGIGLEGGLAPYIEKGSYPIPEIRLWAMMKQAITECGCRPGADVAIALDPAMSELELAYRAEFNVPDSVGTYLFWRDKGKVVLDRDGVLDLYATAVERYDIPILSIEDGFSENDHEGWRRLQDRLGDRILVIGDDLVTTNDRTIETAADQGLINCALIKANQIGSLYETLLAMLVALGKGLELVVSHRSKSPNDDMEAHIALAANALGLKAGGGANTERLVKYQSVMELLLKLEELEEGRGLHKGAEAVIRRVRGYEEPTNAGIPTVGATVEVLLPSSGIVLSFRGATPLGTSAGTGEAIHLVDATLEYAEQKELIDRYPALFRDVELGVHAFRKGVDETKIRAEGDEELTALFLRAERYAGKGCLTAADNVRQIIAPSFEGKSVADLTLLALDRALLQLELRTSRRRGKLAEDAGPDECISVMQRKQNTGMNAMLPVSLAIGRGIARVQGKELFEVLREEMLSIIDRLAAQYGVELRGNRFPDYVVALRDVASRLRREGKPLYEALRAVTGIYREAGLEDTMPMREPGQAVAVAARSERRILSPAGTREVLETIAVRLGKPYEDDVHHGARHARDLLTHAERLATELGVGARIDWKALAAAVALHDAAADRPQHAEASSARAREILSELSGFSEETVRRAVAAIALHEDRGLTGTSRRQHAGLEAQLLYDADQMDAFGAKGVYRYVAVYAKRGKSLDTVREDARARYETLAFDVTRRLVDRTHGVVVDFFDRLAREEASGHAMGGAAQVVRWIRDHAEEHPLRIAVAALAVLGGDARGEDGDRRFAIEYFRALQAAYAEPSAAAEAAVLPAPVRDALPPIPAGAASPALSATMEPARVVQESLLLDGERTLLAELDGALYASLASRSEPAIPEALRAYLDTKAQLARSDRPFGIVNNRLFIADEQLIVPYLIDTTVEVHLVRSGTTAQTVCQQLSPGTILTDSLLLGLFGASGTAVDLEGALYLFDVTHAAVPRIGRIHDVAVLLERVNESTNRNQAVFWLRALLARLCNLSPKDFLGAKNLQPEVRELTTQLTRFLNGRLRRRLPFLSRLLVRNLSSLVGKPNVIDRLWHDTVDLAEIHVPGSAIVNELRRTSHHALGKRTLLIAQAYHAYLETGATEGLASLGFGAPARADVDARARAGLNEIVERVVRDLQRLLGTSEIVTRIEEWKEAYADALMRCEFGSSVERELETVIVKGIRDVNRWVYYHHLRILATKAKGVWWPEGIGVDLGERLAAAMAQKPDAQDFDPEATAQDLAQAVASFTRSLRAAHQDSLFAALGDATGAYLDERFFDAFERARELRGTLARMIERGGFDDQRYYLVQLEGLLEEMGYLALRHIASRYQEAGVDIRQCLEIIRLCALNLRYDGLFSQELNDFAAMLATPGRTDAELLNVLENVERVYHRIRQRVTIPYERMKDRLELEPNDLRLIIANLQRYMHDLNSMVHFADIARATVRERASAGAAAPAAEPERDLDEVNEPILHISHRREIARWLEDGDGALSLRERYGAKGSGLVYISHLNVPTRDGFMLPTAFAQTGMHRLDPGRLREEVATHLRILERDIAERDGAPKRFGGGRNPLLVAVRGGSVLSMPGILSTVVFVGMNDEIAEGLAEDGVWGAYDSYRRFLASYASAVWGVDLEEYQLVEKAKQRHAVRYKQELPGEAMKEIAEHSKRILRDLGFGERLDTILQDPFEQLMGAVDAVMGSWSTERARRFRDIKGICHTWNTAVIVQEMAFGNRVNDPIVAGMDETRASLTGVITHTYATDTGGRALEGELKFSAAGDDLVGGVTFSGSLRPIGDLATLMPMLERRLRHIVGKVRRFMGTDQEVEFTVDRGLLSVLQTRRAEAHLDQATDRFLEPGDPATRGLGIRGGGFRGLVAFDAADLEALSGADLTARDDVDGVLLVIDNPTPEDIPLIISADGLLAARGGSTSHAAVAVNGIDDRDYVGVVSAARLQVRADQHEAVILDEQGRVAHRIRKGDVVSIHGTTGAVYIGSRRRQRLPEQVPPPLRPSPGQGVTG